MPGEFWPVKISWRKIVFSAVKRFVTSDICICFRPHARAHCLSVCLSVCVQDYSKTRAWIWMKCCVSTDVGTWTNLLTFQPDTYHSPDAGT